MSHYLRWEAPAHVESNEFTKNNSLWKLYISKEANHSFFEIGIKLVSSAHKVRAFTSLYFCPVATQFNIIFDANIHYYGFDKSVNRSILAFDCSDHSFKPGEGLQTSGGFSLSSLAAANCWNIHRDSIMIVAR